MTASAKGLFEATRKKAASDDRQAEIPDLPKHKRRKPERRPDDFYPTGEPEAIRGLLAADGSRIRRSGKVWEPACGDGAIVREIRAAGIPCVASDLIDRGCPDSSIGNFLETTKAAAPAIITNPPFNLITARDGKGIWLRHTLDLPGWDYLALLLDWNWPAGKINGLGALLDERPFSYCYLMRWKLDFTGEGQAPQRNAWFVWDRLDPRAYHGRRLEPGFRFLDRVDPRQDTLF